MNELGTALRELAHEATPPVSDPADLWASGRTRVRRRRVLAAAAAACVLGMVGLGALVIPQPAVVMPAGQPHAPGLPSSIYQPVARLAGTDTAGPLGRLVVLAGGRERHRNGSVSDGIFGISATTGAYRFIDLPDQVAGTRVQLSPDGSRIAYWIAGPTTGIQFPNTLHGGKVIGGVAVYDTETGGVQRSYISSEHGLDSSTSFTWVDPQTVLFYNDTITKADMITVNGIYRWTLGQQPVALAEDNVNLGSLQPNPDGTLLNDTDRKPPYQHAWQAMRWTGQHLAPVPGTHLALPIELTARNSQGELNFRQVSRSGDLVAVVTDLTTAAMQSLLGGTVGRDGVVSMLHPVGTLTDVQVLGWRDADTVLVSGVDPGHGSSLVELDLRTGVTHRLGVAQSTGTDWTVQIASDLASAQIVPGRRPTAPQDGPWRASGVAAGVVLALAGVWLLRRRTRV